MTRVDFYQIESDEDPLFFTCRLIEKIYRRGHRVYVHTADSSTASSLDDQLWCFRDDRFIPHSLQQADTTLAAPVTDPAPIRIGHDHEPVEHQDVLINLSGEVPHFFSRFERVAEVVPKNQNLREAARVNYRFYKDRGYPLEYHRMQTR